MQARHCWWFSDDSGRCMHKNNSIPFRAWCAAGVDTHGNYLQHDPEEIDIAGCDNYKPWKTQETK